MEKKQFRGEYLAPQVKVVDMQTRQHMLAGSDYYAPAKDNTTEDGTEQYVGGNTDSWF